MGTHAVDSHLFMAKYHLEPKNLCLWSYMMVMRVMMMMIIITISFTVDIFLYTSLLLKNSIIQIKTLSELMSQFYHCRELCLQQKNQHSFPYKDA